MTAKNSTMKPGVNLVAKYKGSEYTCGVVEEDGALRFVLADGRSFKSPSAAGRAITATQVNGYRFWTVVDALSGGSAGPHSVRTRIELQLQLVSSEPQ